MPRGEINLKRLSLVLACAACGSPSAKPDATVMSDADADSDAYVVPVGPVTLTSLYYDARVFFQGPDGSLIDVKNVGANGSVTLDVPLGSNVTAVLADCCGRSGYDMFSFLHVHPNDKLLVYLDSSYAHTTPTFEVPPDNASGVVGYAVRLALPCGGQITQVVDATTTKQIETDLFCPTPNLDTTTDVLLRSTDQTNVPKNFIYAPNVVLANTTHVDLTASAWAPPTARQLTLTNLPPSAVYRAVLRVLSPHGVLDLVSSEFAQSGTGTVSAVTFPGAIDWYSVMWGDDATHSYRVAHSWGSAATTFTADVANHVLPTVGPASYSGASGMVSWTENGVSNVSPNFVTVSLRATTGVRRAWNVMGPHDGTSITLPRLPVESVDLALTAADSPAFSQLVIANIPGGHQAAPQTPYWSMSVLAPPVMGTSSGTLETSMWVAP